MEIDAMTAQTTDGAVGFTPGPWCAKLDTRYDRETGGTYLVRAEIETGSGLHWIGSVGLRPNTFKHAEANARLIAAAPDLYAALVACKKVLDALTEPSAIKATNPEHVWAHAREAEYKARMALSKARWETSSVSETAPLQESAEAASPPASKSQAP